MSPSLDRPRLTHIALRVDDLDRSIAWYEQMTPLRVLKRLTDEYGRNNGGRSGST